MKIEEVIKVLEQEIFDWKEAYQSYNHTFEEEVNDEGQASEATKEDMRMATSKIKALTTAIETLKRIDVEKITQELYRITDRDNLSKHRAKLIVNYLMGEK